MYSDKNALPFFNSDNCDGDNFYYSTKEKMKSVLEFWKMSYKNKWFVRMSIEDRKISKVIGTIELCLRASDDEFNDMAILRVDVSSGYENEEVLKDLFSLISPCISDLLGSKGIITKAPIYAIDRINALKQLGYTKSCYALKGKNNIMYYDYFVKRSELIYETK